MLTARFVRALLRRKLSLVWVVILAIRWATVRVRLWFLLHSLLRQLTRECGLLGVLGLSRNEWQMILMLLGKLLSVPSRPVPLTQY